MNRKNHANYEYANSLANQPRTTSSHFKCRLKSEVHVKLIMAVKESEAFLFGHKVHFNILIRFHNHNVLY